MLLEYMENVDDKLFKKCSDGKDFNSFTNEFDRATNEENKEKVVIELKDINNFLEHNAQMEDDFREYKCKFFDVVMLLIIVCMNTLKNERVILIMRNTQKLLNILCH